MTVLGSAMSKSCQVIIYENEKGNNRNLERSRALNIQHTEIVILVSHFERPSF